MGARILIVEDNADNLRLLQDLMHALNYDVVTARDGHEAVQQAREARPDLILMDLSLPHLDGWAATGLIKAEGALRHIPIIALTAHAMRGDREKALAAGCDDYLTKPLNMRELAALVHRYLNAPASNVRPPG